MKYGHHRRQISCTPLTTLLIVIFTLRNGKLNKKILLHVLVECVDGVQCVCALMVTILNIETFVTFDFGPSLISRLITDSDLGHIK